jgi:hypothetical protein
MKKCDHFKDQILTDYIDGRLDNDAVQGLENHLLGCGECRTFLKEVRNIASMPFQQASLQPVPAGLWDSIKQGLEHEEQVTDPLGDMIDRLKGFIVFPRLVPVFASLVLMLLAGSVTLNNIQVQQARDKDQGEYLVSLLSSTGSSSQTGNSDLGTPIEHYFL